MEKLLLLLVLAFASNAALAANSVDLRVTGTITPSGCSISIAGGGTFDLGSIYVGDLAETTETILPAVHGQTLNIVCASATQVLFRVSDNRSDSVPAGTSRSDYFGLGVDSANNPIGGYLLSIRRASMLVDGRGAYFKYSTDGGVNWWYDIAHGPYIDLNTNHSTLTTLDPIGNNVPPSPLTSASAALSVRPWIQPTNTLDTSTEISIDGSATIELVYL